MNEPSFYEIIKTENRTNSITLEDNEVENVESNNEQGLFVRVLVNGNWGFASSNKLNKQKTLKEAIDGAKNNPSQQKKELAKIKTLNKSIKQKVKKDPIDVSPKTKIDLLRDARKEANQESIKSTKIRYSDAKTKLNYTNSEDADATYVLYRTGASAKAIAKKGKERQSAQERVFGTKGYEIFEEENFLEKCKEMGERAVSLLKADSAPSGRYPAILDPDLAGVFVHEALGHAAEGDTVAMDNSVLKDKLGQKIGSEKVTIKDDPSIKGLFGSYPFDWEGVESKETTIIKDGELKNYLNSRESAIKTNSEVTPNFRSQSFSNNPLVRMSNTYLEEGDHSFDELIEDINKGVYLKGSRGGQVSPGEGDFQFSAEEGYLIKNGEIKDHIKDVSLSGKTLQTLKNIEKLSKEKKFSSGKCGKGTQLVPVTDGAPYTKISEVLVGGERSV